MLDPSNNPPHEPGPGEMLGRVSARVPENVGRGVFSTGAIMVGGPMEFVLDFLVHMTRPHQIVARVVLPHPLVPQMSAALRDNLQKYRQRFGEIPSMPVPPVERRPSIREVYDELKLPDHLLSGVYANAVMISHSPAEFCLDFITGFFPRPAVSCRVFLSAPHVPRLLDGLTQTYNEHLRKLRQAPPEAPKPPPEPPQFPEDAPPA